MPTNIGTYNWTVPDEYDPPDGPVQFTELASDIEATVKAMNLRLVDVETVRLPAVEAPPPITVLRQVTTQANVAISAYTSVIFEAEDIDTANMHSMVTAKERLVCTLPGFYRLAGGVTFSANATGRRILVWYLNGVRPTGIAAVVVPACAASTTEITAADLVVRLVLNDYVELKAMHEGSAVLSVSAGYASAQFICP
jgi:hypothetical protein